MKLQIGDKAPDFRTTATFQAQDGQIQERPWVLSEEVKKGPVLLVFYPGDFTSVCTKQLCDYRDNWEQLKGFNVQIVGVSTNDKNSHQQFAKVNKFPFALLDDSNKEICDKLGMLMFIGVAARGFVLVDGSQIVKHVFKESLPFFKRTASEVADILRKNL